MYTIYLVLSSTEARRMGEFETEKETLDYLLELRAKHPGMTFEVARPLEKILASCSHAPFLSILDYWGEQSPVDAQRFPSEYDGHNYRWDIESPDGVQYVVHYNPAISYLKVDKVIWRVNTPTLKDDPRLIRLLPDAAINVVKNAGLILIMEQ